MVLLSLEVLLENEHFSPPVLHQVLLIRLFVSLSMID